MLRAPSERTRASFLDPFVRPFRFRYARPRRRDALAPRTARRSPASSRRLRRRAVFATQRPAPMRTFYRYLRPSRCGAHRAATALTERCRALPTRVALESDMDRFDRSLAELRDELGSFVARKLKSKAGERARSRFDLTSGGVHEDGDRLDRTRDPARNLGGASNEICRGDGAKIIPNASAPASIASSTSLHRAATELDPSVSHRSQSPSRVRTSQRVPAFSNIAGLSNAAGSCSSTPIA